MSKTSIPVNTKIILWTRAGGRCQYRGCNDELIGDLISGQRDAKFGLIAHIVADEPKGPRGDAVRSPQLAKDVDNLMLMCDKHHRIIDVGDIVGHDESLLIDMKLSHEKRIAGLTVIKEERAAHVLCYGSQIGTHEAQVQYERIRQDMVPERYPADGRAIRIEVLGAPTIQDRSPEYWSLQVNNLRSQFSILVQQRIELREVTRLSVFPLAPQPLLIELGRLLCDIGDAEVRQLRREPKSWRWSKDIEDRIAFRTRRPTEATGAPALILALSANVTDERIHSVLGADASVWAIEAENPNNDIMRRAEDLSEFRRLVRQMLNDIKAAHGESSVISVFPALPVSAAVEVGRVWMPKADLPMLVFDQQPEPRGFVPALAIDGRPGPVRTGDDLLSMLTLRPA